MEMGWSWEYAGYVLRGGWDTLVTMWPLALAIWVIAVALDWWFSQER